MTENDEPVPKLPYGRGLRFSGPELFRIAITIALLVAIIVLTKPCSHAVSTFVMGFDGSAGSAASPAAGSNGLGSAELIPLRGMTDEQVKATVERAQHHRVTKSGGSAGSATGSAAGSAAP